MNDRCKARLAVVEAHVERENAHDLEGVMATFGEGARYHEQAWGEEYRDRDGVRAYYEALITALPDLFIDIKQRHVTEDEIVLEVIIRGTHLGNWRGLPATHRRLEFPLCAVYTFTADDKLAGERIYYDRATVLRQLGLYNEPLSMHGRLTTAVVHPLTLAGAYARQLVDRLGKRRPTA